MTGKQQKSKDRSGSQTPPRPSTAFQKQQQHLNRLSMSYKPANAPPASMLDDEEDFDAATATATSNATAATTASAPPPAAPSPVVDGPPVQVVVRKRPPKESETDVIDCPEGTAEVLVHEHKLKVDLTRYLHTHRFTYDHSFGDDDTTPQIYHTAVDQLVANSFNGGTSTCFCFGQTASGKTFTLFGAGGGLAQQDGDSGGGGGGASYAEQDADTNGVYMMAATDMFQRLEEAQRTEAGREYFIAVSIMHVRP